MYSIYKTGSSLFLKNNNDIDYLVVSWNSEEYFNLPIFRPKIENNIKHEYHICNAHLFFNEMHVWFYLHNNMQLISGPDYLDWYKNKLNIFNPEIATKYKQCLKTFITKESRTSKRWYHALTAVYLYKNNSPYLKDLTREQLKNIQQIHDGKYISDNLYNYIITEINKW